MGKCEAVHRLLSSPIGLFCFTYISYLWLSLKRGSEKWKVRWLSWIGLMIHILLCKQLYLVFEMLETSSVLNPFRTRLAQKFCHLFIFILKILHPWLVRIKKHQYTALDYLSVITKDPTGQKQLQPMQSDWQLNVDLSNDWRFRDESPHQHSDQKFIYLINRSVALWTHCSSGSLKNPTNERQQNIKSWLRSAGETHSGALQMTQWGSLCTTHMGFLAPEKRKTIKTSQRLQRDSCRSREGNHGVAWCLVTSWGLSTPGWVNQVRGLTIKDPEHPMTLRSLFSLMMCPSCLSELMVFLKLKQHRVLWVYTSLSY